MTTCNVRSNVLQSRQLNSYSILRSAMLEVLDNAGVLARYQNGLSDSISPLDFPESGLFNGHFV